MQPLAQNRVSGKLYIILITQLCRVMYYFFCILETFSVALLCLCIASSLKNAVSRVVHTLSCISCQTIQHPKYCAREAFAMPELPLEICVWLLWKRRDLRELKHEKKSSGEREERCSEVYLVFELS